MCWKTDAFIISFPSFSASSTDDAWHPSSIHWTASLPEKQFGYTRSRWTRSLTVISAFISSASWKTLRIERRETSARLGSVREAAVRGFSCAFRCPDRRQAASPPVPGPHPQSCERQLPAAAVEPRSLERWHGVGRAVLAVLVVFSPAAGAVAPTVVHSSPPRRLLDRLVPVACWQQQQQPFLLVCEDFLSPLRLRGVSLTVGDSWMTPLRLLLLLLLEDDGFFRALAEGVPPTASPAVIGRLRGVVGGMDPFLPPTLATGATSTVLP